MNALCNPTKRRKALPTGLPKVTGAGSFEGGGTYYRTTVIVNEVLEYRGDHVLVVEGNVIASYSRRHYRLVKEGGEEV